MGLMGVTAGVRWFTDLAVPGWATFTVGLLLVLVVQLLSFATLFAFLIASRRSSLNFLLTRDAPYFILGQDHASTARPESTDFPCGREPADK